MEAVFEVGPACHEFSGPAAEDAYAALGDG